MPVQTEVGHQPVGELISGEPQAGGHLGDLLRRPGLQGLELHPLRDAVQMQERDVATDRREHIEALDRAMVGTLAGPGPDHRCQAAHRLVVAQPAQGVQRPRLLGGKGGQTPLLEERPGELGQ